MLVHDTSHPCSDLLFAQRMTSTEHTSHVSAGVCVSSHLTHTSHTEQGIAVPGAVHLKMNRMLWFPPPPPSPAFPPLAVR